jgi:hypothetical protein
MYVTSSQVSGCDQNFAACAHTCDTKCDDNDECGGCGCGTDHKCCSVRTNTLGKLRYQCMNKRIWALTCYIFAA